MAMSDPLGDMLTRIRNGQHSRKTIINVPASKLRSKVLDVLKKEGYIIGYTEEEVSTNIKILKVNLKYFQGQPAIKEITRISKPGRRVYSSIKDLGKVYNGLGVSILSTSRGLMTDHEARIENIGGEVLCKLF